jgi:hypothetical protein
MNLIPHLSIWQHIVATLHYVDLFLAEGSVA